MAAKQKKPAAPPAKKKTPSARVIAAMYLQRALAFDDGGVDPAALTELAGSRVNDAKAAKVAEQLDKIAGKFSERVNKIVDKFNGV